MNSKNTKAPNRHRLLVNLSDNANLKEVINILLYQILAYTIHWKNIKTSYKNNKFKHSCKKGKDVSYDYDLKYQFQRGTKNLNYLMDRIRHSRSFRVYHQKSMEK